MIRLRRRTGGLTLLLATLVLAAIDGAERTVALSTYIFGHDAAGRLFADALERDGDMLVIKGKIMGAMPMTAKLSPAEFRKGFALLNLKLVIFLLTFPFRGWGKR